MIKRMIIYAKDVQMITGKSIRWARRCLANIRLKRGKDKDHSVTVTEFCEAMGLDEAEVIKRLIP